MPFGTEKGIAIAVEDPGGADVLPLLLDGEAHSASLYPAESNHHLPLDALRAPNVRFLVARDDQGRPQATGALVIAGDWAEVKRMWVVEAARGRGLSRAMLDRLVEEARAAGVRTLRLETGTASHAALGLYAAAGFVECLPFAEYRPDPLSVFMARAVDPSHG